MKLDLYFTEKEINDFLISKGYTPINKKRVLNYGPYDKLEDVIIEKWVKDIDGSEHRLEDKFEALIKKRLLDW